VANWCAVAFLAATPVAAQAPPPPAQAPPPPTQTSTPKPTPTPAQTPAPRPTAQASAGPVDGASVDPRLAGVPIYAGAAFLQSFDLDKTQTVFVFGTNDSYANVVGFYKNKYRAQEVSKTPAIQQFDLGSFDSGTMTQRPSVVVKDFTWPDAAGYLHVSGTKQTRYVTIIQIIPK
jgi:hypothetical protein